MRILKVGFRAFIALADSSKRMKRIVVFSGAGVSAESGLKTFRDSGGLWEEYDVYEVATPEAWERNPELVIEFYNKRREQVMNSQPNDAHLAIAKLESNYDVQVITQNIDDLHERAGSTKVLHLHGEILKVRSSKDSSLLYDWNKDLSLTDECELGSQLRPHVVWFGEAVTEIPHAIEVIKTAEIVLIIGTSLNVYPAASIVHYAPDHAKYYLVDPAKVQNPGIANIDIIQEKASVGVPVLVEKLLRLQG